MEASPAQIIHFFNGFKQSVIPLFQRPYTWELTEWSTLWDDVMERYEVDQELSHFMGAIVTMPAKSVPVGVSKFVIIDGQQRLTTITVLLCALRDELPSDAKPQRSRIQNHYLINDGYDGLDHLKLLPTQLDRPDFQALVDGVATFRDSKLRSCYEYFRKKIRSTEGGVGIDPVRLLDIIERRLMVVSINLSESDDPYVIFESLNFKGASLTQADLVRNYFLMRFVLSEQQKVYDGCWLPMQARLGEQHLTEFMRHYLMKDGNEVLKGEIYSGMKHRILELDGPAVAAELAAMNRLSVFYLCLVDPSKEDHPEIRRRLNRLRRLDMATSYPLLLRAYDAYGRSAISADEFVALLAVVESFVVRRLICEVPTNQLKKIFLAATKLLPETEPATWLTAYLMPGSHGRRWPRDEEAKEAWSRTPMYTRRNACRFILETLEEAYAHKEPAVLNPATIEHVLPQTMTAAWQAMLGADADATHERLSHTLGNLTLSGYNAELSNDPFEDKKKLFAKSHYEMNRYFETVSTWDAAAIEVRAAVLWNIAKTIWPRPEASAGGE